ncbi:MAG: IS5 family transposase [Syntrophobacterales bacterium]|nr:IS5 family transposase [Syntrophobacterales bacterium]
MGYKRADNNMTFAEMSLLSSMEHNRSLKRLEKISQLIDWSQVREILDAHYTVGTSREGADAYSPVMLLKALLLQQWYHIDSDPELENQINDRVSFKKFIGLSFDKQSPDHSTFSRFRGRLSKDAMININSVVLQQFAKKGFVINEGVAVDARLVQSASHPISKEEIKKELEKRETPEGKLDKNGKPLKFSRDMESDWVIKNEKPHYGFKEHASVDTKHGLVLATELTPASVSDSIYLPFIVASSCHTEEPIEKVYADKGYYGKPNRDFLAMNYIEDGIMRKDTKSTKLTTTETERNKKLSKKRYIVEQYFGISHLHYGAFRARFTRMVKNALDNLFRQMAFNLFRGNQIIGTVKI